MADESEKDRRLARGEIPKEWFDRLYGGEPDFGEDTGVEAGEGPRLLDAVEEVSRKLDGQGGRHEQLERRMAEIEGALVDVIDRQTLAERKQRHAEEGLALCSDGRNIGPGGAGEHTWGQRYLRWWQADFVGAAMVHGLGLTVWQLAGGRLSRGLITFATVALESYAEVLKVEAERERARAWRDARSLYSQFLEARADLMKERETRKEVPSGDCAITVEQLMTELGEGKW